MAPRPKLTPEQERQVCDRYQAKEPMHRLADEYRVCAGTIKNVLIRHGIDRTANFRNLTVEEIEEVRRRYHEGETSYQLAAAFGVSRPAINRHIRSEGKPKGDRASGIRLYHCNHDYFANIDTPEKAYFLGFITADGCINKTYSTSPELTIVLKGNDVSHLEMLNQLLENDRPVRTYEHKGYKFCRLAVSSQKMASDLAIYGIVPRKSLTIGWPQLETDLYRHFLRGLFDGDGNFGITNRKKCLTQHLYVGLIGSQLLVPSALDFLRLHCGLPLVGLSPRYQKNGQLSTFNFRYTGNTRCLAVANFLYEDATVYLDRKRQIVLDHYRSLPKYRDQLRFG